LTALNGLTPIKENDTPILINLERKLDNHFLKINSVKNNYIDEVADFRDHRRDRFTNSHWITAL
jgi:hypothetical protein